LTPLYLVRRIRPMTTIRLSDSSGNSNDVTGSYTYLSDLSSMNLSVFDSGESLQWVHALPLGGPYKHPKYGDLNFTPERIMRFVQNVKNKVRGIDPDVDYDHKMDPAKGNIAAGWVRDADARSDGLWLLVDWTKKAIQSLRDREYRYFSAEFLDEWEDSQGNKFEDVVLGGGLTNRPFMKNLVPVNLNEITASNQEDVMDRAEIARILGLGENATDDEITAKLNELVNKGEQPKIDINKLSVTAEDGVFTISHPDIEGDFKYTPEAQTNNDEKELAKLAEGNPLFAKVLSELSETKQQLTDIQASARLSEISTQLSEVGKDAKVVLPPAVQDKLRKVMVRLPKTLSDDIADAMQTLVKVGGPVKLGETSGSGKDGAKPTEKDDVTLFLAEVDALREKNKELSYRDAVDQAKAANLELYYRYRDAVSEGRVRLNEEA
jgi:hypothetical protein